MVKVGVCHHCALIQCLAASGVECHSMAIDRGYQNRTHVECSADCHKVSKALRESGTGLDP